MKVRNGFVSNSSSSSFILLVGEPKECPTCNIKFNLLNLIEKCKSHSDTKIVLEGIEDFKEEIENLKKQYFRYWGQDNSKIKFEDSYEYSRTVALNDSIEKSKINKDKTLVEIEIEYHDEFLNSIFKHLVDIGQVVVLSSCEV